MLLKLPTNFINKYNTFACYVDEYISASINLSWSKFNVYEDNGLRFLGFERIIYTVFLYLLWFKVTVEKSLFIIWFLTNISDFIYKQIYYTVFIL